MIKFVSFCFLSLWVVVAYSDDNKKDKVLPEPLSFQAALAFASHYYHYSFLDAQTSIALAKANSDINLANDDLNIYLEGYVRQVGVSDLGDKTRDKDYKVSLVVKKKLYDFGLTSKKEQLFNTLISVKEAELELKKTEYLNKVAAAYFQILRADNQYLADNENMSIAFIRFNRAQENAEFGLTSDIEILAAQSNYEKVRQQRYASEAQQRYSRQVFAELVGSTTLPDQLEIPHLDMRRDIIDDVSQIIELALKNSKVIQLQQVKLKAAQHAIDLASANNAPSFDAVVELNDYQYDTATRDEWRAGINFNIPLYVGDRSDVAVQLAQTKYRSAVVTMQQLQSELSVKVLELWQRIKQKTLEYNGALVKQEYRDLYLEQSRANYELEYKSDLGDSMVQFSRSRAERYSIEFDLEIAWRELFAMVGDANIHKIQKQNVTEEK